MNIQGLCYMNRMLSLNDIKRNKIVTEKGNKIMANLTLIERMTTMSKLDFSVKIFFVIGFIIVVSNIFCIGRDAIFGAIVTAFGIIYAIYLVSEQMSQAGRNLKRQALRSHVVSASENVHLCEIYEGLVVGMRPEDKFIASWCVNFGNNKKSNNYHFHFFFKALSKNEDVEEIIKSQGAEPKFWDYQVIIPRFERDYGIIIEHVLEGNPIDEMDDDYRVSVMSALKRIQFYDRRRLGMCYRNLCNSHLKGINYKLTRMNIFSYTKPGIRKY